MESNIVNINDDQDYIAIDDLVNPVEPFDIEAIKELFFQKSHFELRCKKISEEIIIARPARISEKRAISS